MKLQKVTSKKALDAGLVALEAGVGFAASNAAVGPLNSLVNNKMASKGILAVVGLTLAIAVPNNHVKAIGAGMAAKQTFDLVKDAVAPHVPSDGIIADALEIEAAPQAAPEGMGRLNRAMGNAEPFRIGNPLGVNYQLG